MSKHPHVPHMDDDAFIASLIKQVNEAGGDIVLPLSLEHLEHDPAKAAATIEHFRTISEKVKAATGHQVVFRVNEAAKEDAKQEAPKKKSGTAAFVVGLGLMTLFATESCKKDKHVTPGNPGNPDGRDTTVIVPGDSTHTVDTIYVVGNDTAFIKNGDTTWRIYPGKFCLAGEIGEQYGDQSNNVAVLNEMAKFTKIAVEPGYYPYPSQLPKAMARVTIGTVDRNNSFEAALAAQLDGIPGAWLPTTIHGRQSVDLSVPAARAAVVEFIGGKAAGFEKGAYIYGVNDYLSTFPGKQAGLEATITAIGARAGSKPLVYADCHANKDVLKKIYATTNEIAFHWYGLDAASFQWARGEVAKAIMAANEVGLRHPRFDMVAVVPASQHTPQNIRDMAANYYNPIGDYAKQITNRNVIPVIQVFNAHDGSFLDASNLPPNTDASLPNVQFKGAETPFGDPTQEAPGELHVIPRLGKAGDAKPGLSDAEAPGIYYAGSTKDVKWYNRESRSFEAPKKPETDKTLEGRLAEKGPDRQVG